MFTYLITYLQPCSFSDCSCCIVD